MSRGKRLVVLIALTCVSIAAPGPAQAKEAEPNAAELVRAVRRSEKLSIPVPLRTMTGDTEMACRSRGARSLPWLILADRERFARAEGFRPDELDTALARDLEMQK